MGGVTGYWGYSSQDLAEAVFAAFTHSLAHRGPDGFGIEHFPEARLWLGHRRLAILDLSERARQPMSYAEGRYWLTYNGEVYNYLELREELRGLGHRFVSGSDSEVILAAYAQWGQECQLRFNGMWAFAIWDAQERRLFLSRDRFGVKPLLYSDHAGAFAFASELKAFLTLPWIDGAFDPEIVAETLTNINGQEATPYTLLPGVRRLPAGHAMVVQADGSVRINAWWNTLDHLPQPRAKLDEQAEEFRALFFDACRIRLRSQVPVATALSGGLDSSAIACTLAELHRRGAVEGAPQDSQRAFVACFPGTPYDERQYAEAIVNHTGMVPQYHNVDDNLVVNNIEKVILDREGIYRQTHLGVWSTYRVMQDAGIGVSVEGHGGDELLGGYRFCVERAIEAAAGSLSLWRYLELRRVLHRLDGDETPLRRDAIPGEAHWFARRQLARLGLLEPLRAVAIRLRKMPIWNRGKMAAHDYASRPLLRPYNGPTRLYDPHVMEMSTLQAMLFTWFHGDILPTTLRALDRASMANGIEVRMPFMDWRLVTFAFALPETSKMGGGYTKRVLREAMRGLTPEAIRLRTNKIGVVSLTESWVRGPLKSWLLDLTASRSFVESSVWNGYGARAAVELAVDGAASISPVWPILNAYVLEQSFKVRARHASAALAQNFTT
jgi:asparagine synthase (glutamine-hydrolysing)